ncbi:MAG: 6-phosphogluconolactonase [Deltaproteobacteria bacterium HGW-Deltaproteobacteria-4]|nr:MAG: 6-phosphogluconolactonase [Deltaproteobacteria bacterium HGW-Deltaproteobacteria-4]
MIKVFADQEALARAAAEFFAAQARQAVAARGRFLVLLAGGETPRRTYQLLAQDPLRRQIPWREVHFFWGDERCVPSDDPRSNAAMAQRSLLDRLPLRPEQIHSIRYDRSPQASADRYQAELTDFFAGAAPCFDLALLGIGNDGHTASLLPGSAALEEQVRWTAVTRRREEDFSRITLTAPIINQATVVLFLVAGADKAAMLAKILNAPTETIQYPAQRIRPRSGELRWWADRAAAGLLDESV